MNHLEEIMVRPSRAALYRVLVLTLGLVSLIPTGFVLAQFFRPQMSFGIDVDSVSLLVDEVDPAAKAVGVRLGDRLDAAAMPFGDRVALFGQFLPSPGTRIVLPIVRNGERRSYSLVAFVAGQLPNYEYAFIWFGLLGALLWVFVGCVLVLLRPGTMTWGFYLFALGMHPVYQFWTFFGPLPLAALCLLSFSTILALAHAGIIAFAARFPNGQADGAWRLFDVVAIAVFFLLLPVYLTGAMAPITGFPSVALSYGPPVAWFSYGAVAVALGIRLVRLQEGERAALGWVAAGCAGALGAVYFWNYQLQDRWVQWTLYSACNVSLPICVLFAVLQRRAFALGFLANRTLVYGFFAATVASAFVALDWLLSSAVIFSSRGISVGLGASLALGMLLQAQHGRVVRFIDRIFLPQRYAAGIALDRIREAVRSGAGRPGEAVAGDVAEALGLASLAVFGRTKDGGFVRQLSCGWPDDSLWHLLPGDQLCRTLAAANQMVRLSERDVAGIALPLARPTLAISVRRGGRIERAILVGERRNGSALDRDQLRGLSAVLSEVAAA